MFLPFPKIPSQSLLRPAENLLPDQEPDEPDEPEPSDDAMEDDDNEGGESQESEESDGEIVGTDIDSGSDAQSPTGQDVQGCLEPSAVVVSEESPLGSQSGTPLVAVEQVVLQHPDGSSEVYELDANRDSNIPPEKLPLVGTKIGDSCNCLGTLATVKIELNFRISWVGRPESPAKRKCLVNASVHIIPSTNSKYTLLTLVWYALDL